MRLSDLRDKQVRTLDGEKLGRIHEVHCDAGRVIALVCGAAGLIERWTAKGKARRIPWECVRKIEPGAVIVTPDPPQRASGSRAARSRQGTRRPSARPSKR